jgi:hypothetical protein
MHCRFPTVVGMFQPVLALRSDPQRSGRRYAAKAAQPKELERKMVTATQAHDQAVEGDHVIGWKIDPRERESLLVQFPARYGNVVADHVTLRSRVARDAALPEESSGEIVGWTDDGQGVEALVVRIGGTTERPGGGTYHITWSLGPGREARESNAAIGKGGWKPVDPPVPLRLRPAAFPRSSGRVPGG